MKKIKFLSTFLIVCALLSLSVLPSVRALENPQLTANAVVLLELNSGNTFLESNANSRVAPASVTKIMTVLLAVEACDAGTVHPTDEVIAVESFSYDLIADGSTANIQTGEVLTLEQLMYLALVASANDACNVIAEYVGGGISNFISMMNSRASELGCTGTNFANTHGLPNDNHYTTAWDLSLIAREAASIGKFAEIWGTKYYEVPATNMSDVRYLTNTNALLTDNTTYSGYTYEYATGGKTGYTEAAGYCLISTAAKDDISLLAVVMGSQAIANGDGTTTFGQFSDSIALYNWAFENFSYREVLRSSEIITQIPVEMGSDTDSVSVRPDSSIVALLPNDTDLNSFTRDIVIFSQESGEALQAPISTGEVLGEITVSRNGVSYGKTNLIAASGVDLSKLHYMRTQIQETMKSGAVKAVFWILLILFIAYLVLVIRYRVLRMRHNRSIREAKMERAARQADAEARRYSGSAGRDSDARREEPEMEFFSNEDEYYAQDEHGHDEPDGQPAQQGRDYFEEFFKK